MQITCYRPGLMIPPPPHALQVSTCLAGQYVPCRSSLALQVHTLCRSACIAGYLAYFAGRLESTDIVVSPVLIDSAMFENVTFQVGHDHVTLRPGSHPCCHGNDTVQISRWRQYLWCLISCDIVPSQCHYLASSCNLWTVYRGNP